MKDVIQLFQEIAQRVIKKESTTIITADDRTARTHFISVHHKLVAINLRPRFVDEEHATLYYGSEKEIVVKFVPITEKTTDKEKKEAWGIIDKFGSLSINKPDTKSQK